MPRYWVIAPVESKDSKLFDRIWQFDLANSVISIGWAALGDVSGMSREQLANAVSSEYPDKPPQTKALTVNMIWSFYHEIQLGDLVIARRGQKVLAAVGRVIQTATYTPDRNPDNSHPHYLGVEWQSDPRDKTFDSLVFVRPTLREITEDRYRSLLAGSAAPMIASDATRAVEESGDPINAEVVLERYLEDFIVTNFDAIFRGKYKIYEESDEVNGQQYRTDVGVIDILAVEPHSNAFIVIELKKGRPSDQVVGQVLRYMGWVKAKLSEDGQTVKGLVICHDPDDKLSYAIEMTNNIDVRYYSVSFNLTEKP